MIVSYSLIKISQIPFKSFLIANSLASAACGLIVFSINSKTSLIFDSFKSFISSDISFALISSTFLWNSSNESLKNSNDETPILLFNSFLNFLVIMSKESSNKTLFWCALDSSAILAEIGTTFAKYFPNFSLTYFVVVSTWSGVNLSF